MIWDSGPWKGQLLSDADLLQRWAAKRKATERRSFLIERKIFISAYAIRKLFEAKKVSTSFEQRLIECRAFSAKSDRITLENNHKLEELYYFDNPVTKRVGVRHLLNQIIHSFVFVECTRDDLTIEGFFVTSDHKRYTSLLLIPMPAFIDVMREIGQDYPSSSMRIFDKKKNDWFFWQGHGDPPQQILDKLNTIRGRGSEPK